MKISFLLDNAYGIGGTIRSTVNLSRALADRHTVEVVSLRRTVDEPSLPFDPRVAMTELIDLRPGSPAYDGDDPLFKQRSDRFTEGSDHFTRGIANRLGDVRVAEFLRTTDADVVIATRPKLIDYLAAYGENRYLRIGQEHLTHTMHSEHTRTHQDAAITRLDAFVTVSYADAAEYRACLPVPAVHSPRSRAVLITCIPNAVPATDIEPSDGESKLIVAAGRLIKVKRYDRLLNAFALVSERHPDWRLRLYGRGKQHAVLRARIDNLGLYDKAFLMGVRAPIETEWAKGAIAAVSSDAESFGMTLVEAMHCGVPVVSTDCPYGPGEIISNGTDGLLAPLGNERAAVRNYADALLQLIENPELRRKMGHASLEKAARYAPGRIVGEYEQLIEKLLTQRSAAPAAGEPEPGRPDLQRIGDGQLAPGESEFTRSVPAPGKGPRNGLGSRPTKAELARPEPARPEPARRKRETERAGAAKTAPASPGRPLRARLRRLAVRSVGPVLLPLRRRLRGGGQAHSGARGMRRQLGHARVGADGSLTVKLLAAQLPKGESALLLRARHDDVPMRRVTLPPCSAAVDGWVEVQLDRDAHQLAEDRWDAYVERAADGKRKRIRAELVETARLLSSPAPLDADGVLNPWVPYTTVDGFLAVRVWHRPGHAEVTSVALGRESCTVRAELYGTAARRGGGIGSVIAVPRTEAEPGFELPVTPAATTATGHAGAPGTAPAITFELPYELPAALDSGDLSGVWDLWFRPGGHGDPGGEPVRLGRLLDDLADRKKIDVLPTARLGGSETGVRFYFSLSNDLVVTLKQLPPEQLDERDKASAGATETTPAGTTAGTTAKTAPLEARAREAAEREPARSVPPRR